MKKILKPIVTMRETYEKSLEKKIQIRALPLNMALISNPFLKGQEQFKKIHHQFLLYNKRAISNLVEDQYEVKSYEKFHEIMSQLANLEARKDQLNRLQECVKWWNNQKRIIKQRKDLGVVKYKTDKQMDKVRVILEKMSGQKEQELQGTLPNDLRFKEVFPFQMGYRTAQSQMEVPIKRLPQYKRKLINLNDNNLLDETLVKKGQKVTYPMPKKIQPPESGDALNPENNTSSAQQGQTNQAGTAIINPQNPNSSPVPEGAVVQPAVEDPNKVVEQAGQDLGMGLGQQPGQAEDQPAQQEPQQDKLAPKNKIYTNSIKQEKQFESLKKFQKPYLFYRGNQSHSDRRMEQRALLKQQYSLQMQRQQTEFINKAHNWATQKSKIDKQIAFKLSSMKANHSFTFSYEQPQKKEMLSPAEERRYGVYQPSKPLGTAKQIDFSDKLPGLNLSQPIEKQIKKDRLNSLKNRFSTILNIRQSNDIREKPNGTMCQTSPQRKSFSMILEEHSLQKQRMNELEQIQKIKQSLGKHRVNINIRTLAQALVPDSESYKLQSFSSPPKMLPSNPFFVEVKKKKKKK